MIGEVTIKTYKLNKKYSYHFQKYGNTSPREITVEEGRIIFCASYTGSNGFTKSKIWVLATPTEPAYVTYEQPLRRVMDEGFLDEINLDDEFKLINNHLNKEVRYLLRKNKMLTSQVLLEKYPFPTTTKSIFLNNELSIRRMLQERASNKPTFLQKIMGIN